MRSLMTWKPLASVSPFTGDVDRFFDEFFTTTPSAHVPAADIVESEDAFTLSVDLPGMRREDIQISVEDNYLIVRGRRVEEAKEEKANLLRHERFTGEISRSFRLGDQIAVDKIEATYKDGVLHVSVPKAETAKPRVIEVK